MTARSVPHIHRRAQQHACYKANSKQCAAVVVLLFAMLCKGDAWETPPGQQPSFSNNAVKDFLDLTPAIENECPTRHCTGPLPKDDQWILREAELAARLQCQRDEPALEKAFAYWVGGPKFNPALFPEICGRITRNQINAGRVAALHAYAVILLEGAVYLRCCGGQDVCQAVEKEGDALTVLDDLSLSVALMQDLLEVIDLELQLIVTFGDEPFTSQVMYGNMPVFHPAGSDAYWTIPWPSVRSMRALLGGELDIDSEERTLSSTKWDDRFPKAWWRGTLIAPSTAVVSTAAFLPRIRLQRLAAQNPGLLDTAITAVHQTLTAHQWGTKHVQRVLHENGIKILPRVDFLTQAPLYKYLLVLPGVTQSHQLTDVLRSGAVPLLVWDTTYEFLQPLLEPWTHYVPIHSDLSNLLDVLNWLRDNDDKARQIAARAYEISMERLRPAAIYCYLWRALRSLRNLTAEQRPALRAAVAGFKKLPRLDLGRLYPRHRPLRRQLVEESHQQGGEQQLQRGTAHDKQCKSAGDKTGTCQGPV